MRFVIILVTSLMMGCSTTPSQSQNQVSFPVLTIQDNPNDPQGLCLSKEDAAELALYIRSLRGY